MGNPSPGGPDARRGLDSGEPDWSGIRARHRELMSKLSGFAVSTAELRQIEVDAEGVIGESYSLLLDQGPDSACATFDQAA